MDPFKSTSSAALEQIKNEMGPPTSPIVKLAGKLSELAGIFAEAIRAAHRGEDILRAH